MNDPETFTIEGLPVTTNCAYRRGRQGGLYMTPEAKAWKEAAAWQIKSQRVTRQEWAGGAIRISLSFHMTRPLGRDVDGMVKAVVDSVAEALAFDDRYVFNLHVYKMRDREDKTGVSVSEVYPCPK